MMTFKLISSLGLKGKRRKLVNWVEEGNKRVEKGKKEEKTESTFYDHRSGFVTHPSTYAAHNFNCTPGIGRKEKIDDLVSSSEFGIIRTTIVATDTMIKK